ncbi:MAG: DUF1631 domain-containing protein [Burkholderiales bacterium]|nr:DUF1631 domain-containing protein [Burkholderiales bacterium]
MTRVQSQLSSKTAATGHNRPAVRLAHMLIAQTQAYFAEHETKNLNLVRAHLMELVDDKPAMGQGQNLRSAHLLLGKYAMQFNRGFQQTLADCMAAELALILPQDAQPVRPNAADDALNGLSLSLLDVGEVERVLLLDRVAQRFGARYDAVLEPLTERLSVMFGRQKSSIHDNPFQPAVLLRAFVSAWDKCELDSQASDDLLQSLQPGSWLDLAPLYTQLHTALVKAGVPARRAVPVRPSDIARTSSEPPAGSNPLAAQTSAERGKESTRSGAVPLEGGQQPKPWASLDTAGRAVAAHARQFLQRLGLGSHAARADNDQGPMDADSEIPTRPDFAAASPALMGYLGDLQAGASADATFPANHRYEARDLSDHNVLRQMRERDEIRHAPELDRGTVDALAEVFDFVFADQAIPIQMKFIIGRLQIPVLKAAMIDRDFFLSDQHPARRLVDTLAGASVAWAPEKGEHDPLYVRIEHTVQRVLTEFENDLTLFVDLLREFTEFLFESEQRAQVRVEPVAEQERTGESWEHALEQADELIHERIQALSAEQAVAPFLLPFLTTQWREVMARAWLDEATREQNYAQCVKTMEQLIWSIQPKTSSEERRGLVAVLPDMVRQLNVGLDSIAWNGKPRATFTRRLITTHTLAIRLTQPIPLDTGSAELENRDGQAALQQLDERRAARQVGTQDHFDAMAQSFERGMWFEVSLEQEAAPVRCRLSWVSPMRTRLLFTNREGFDAFVRSEREVSAMLRLGRMRVLDNEAIVGRALDKIMVDGEQQRAA